MAAKRPRIAVAPATVSAKRNQAVIDSGEQVQRQVEAITTRIRSGKFLTSRDVAATTRLVTKLIQATIFGASW